MTVVQTGRWTVENRSPLVVFLIGARVNKWWLLPFSLPILSRMNTMLRELLADPQSGLLAVEQLGFGTSVQYWRSLEHLHAYANNPKQAHRPAWVEYMKKLFTSAASGVWHETYLVQAESYEATYVNMPARGLGRVFPLVPADGALSRMEGRLGKLPSSDLPQP